MVSLAFVVSAANQLDKKADTWYNMLTLAAKGLAVKYEDDTRAVTSLRNARQITPLSVLRMRDSDVEPEVMDFTLYDIVTSSTTLVENIEMDEQRLCSRSFTYLVKVTSITEAFIARSAGVFIPSEMQSQENLYYKCSFTFEDLTVRSVDPIKMKNAINHWWSVDINHDLYTSYMEISMYDYAVITSSVQTNRDTRVEVELIGLDKQGLDDEILIELGDEFPGYKQTGQAATFTIPSGLALTYQYTEISVDEAGGIIADIHDVSESWLTGQKTALLNTERDCALPILELVGNNEYRFVKENLERILMRPEVRGLPVCVVSIVGAFRTGKTFMLNFFKKFLEEEPRLNWLTDPLDVAGRCDFFEWSGGEDAHTMGLHMWSRPFVVDSTSTGKVAVLLMDTQGTFDHKSSTQSTATIFALSTLVSSVQVYNISSRIGEDSLRHLEYFAEYGKHAVEGKDAKPFQNLIFLVRDHPRTSHLRGSVAGKLRVGGEKLPDYGTEAGERYLQKVLKVDELTQSSEQRHVRDALNSMFESLSCFLLPRPGNDIMDGYPFDYNNPMSDPSNKDFLSNIQDFVYSVLFPNNLLIKEQNGTPLTTDTYLLIFEKLATVFTGGELPQIRTLLEATTDADNAVAAAKSKAAFMSELQQFTSQKKVDLVVAEGEFSAKVKLSRGSAIKAFQDSPRFGGERYSREHLETLERELTEIAEGYKQELSEIPTEGEARDNCQAALERCMGHFRKTLQEFKAAKRDCPTVEKFELQEFYQATQMEVVMQFQSQPKLGNDKIKQPYVEILGKQIYSAWQPVREELSQKPTMREAQDSHERAQRDAENYFRNSVSKAIMAALEEHTADLTSFQSKMNELKTLTVNRFKAQVKFAGSDLFIKHHKLLVECLEEEIIESIKIVQKRAMNDAACRTAYNDALAHYTDGMDKFVQEKRQSVTMEKEDITDRYHLERSKWLRELLSYTNMKPMYINQFSEACETKYREVCARLKDKPTKSELEQRNDSIVFRCLQLYKDDFKKFVEKQIDRKVYDPANVKKNHETCKNHALSKFDGSPLLGGDPVRSKYKQWLKEAIERNQKESLDMLKRSSAYTVADANMNNLTLRSKCYIKYVKAMRKEAHYSWKERSMWASYRWWFEKKHPGISSECLQEFDTGKIGSHQFSLSQRKQLELDINTKYDEFKNKKDRWFRLNGSQKNEYNRGQYKLSDEREQ